MLMLIYVNLCAFIKVKVELGLDGKQLQCQKSVASSTDTAQVPEQTQGNEGMVSQAVALSSTTDKHDVVTSKPPLPTQ